MQTAPSFGDESMATFPRPTAIAARATSRATGASAAMGVAFMARRSRGVTASSASPVLARSARSAGRERVRREEIVERRVEGALHARSAQLDGSSFERRQHRPADASGVRAAAEVEHRRQDLERRRRESPGRQRAPRVGPCAIEQDVEGGRLSVPRVELGEGAQKADVLRELAPRALEGLLRPPVVVRRLLVDERQLDDPLALLFRRLTPLDEVLLQLDGSSRVVLALVDVDELRRRSRRRRART